MTHPPHCPQCSKIMMAGFILDTTHGGIVQSKWVAGLPEKSFWTGIKLGGKARLPVISFRCPRCGLLQSYALEG